MLPEILEVAEKNGLVKDPRSRLGKKEMRYKCPFCFEDSKPNKKHRYYLSLNSTDQVFKCWFCGESGGVLRFIALLEGVPEAEVVAKYRKRKIIHPAERLTRNQRKLLCFVNEPDWKAMKNRDRDYYLRTLDVLWEEWKSFFESEKRKAFQTLTGGILLGKYTDAIKEIKDREVEMGASLVEEVLNIYSCAERPNWTESAEKFVKEIIKPISPEPISAGREKGEATC